jgi:hypothetical protein
MDSSLSQELDKKNFLEDRDSLIIGSMNPFATNNQIQNKKACSFVGQNDEEQERLSMMHAIKRKSST